MQDKNEEAPITWLEQQLKSEQQARQAEQEKLEQLQRRLGEREAYIHHLQGVIEGLKSRVHTPESAVKRNPGFAIPEAEATWHPKGSETELSDQKEDRELPKDVAQSDVFYMGNLGSKENIAVQPNRSPSEMIRPEYQGFQRLGDLIESLLNQVSQPITAKGLTTKIYDCSSDKEFSRARNSLSSELRNGASLTPPRWQKLSRTTYASNSWQSPALHS